MIPKNVFMPAKKLISMQSEYMSILYATGGNINSLVVNSLLKPLDGDVIQLMSFFLGRLWFIKCDVY